MESGRFRVLEILSVLLRWPLCLKHLGTLCPLAHKQSGMAPRPWLVQGSLSEGIEGSDRTSPPPVADNSAQPPHHRVG